MQNQLDGRGPECGNSVTRLKKRDRAREEVSGRYKTGASQRAIRSPARWRSFRRFQSLRRISTAFSRSAVKASSIRRAVSSQRTSRSHSELKRKERKSRLVEPTTET